MEKYQVSAEVAERLNNEGAYHAPFGDQAQRYETMRQHATDLKMWIAQNTPASREQSLALTALDEATFWSNAAIARHESQD